MLVTVDGDKNPIEKVMLDIVTFNLQYSDLF